ncbi:tether containing UBX domain for GLUT4-like isoform X2 [Ornithodoros turicata]|uniref:tether containing UBX domain for GLUT4-like isoform X2 n=1 Tax=Ornithodoros turicata TaxID=34597 RepID=UPI00313A0222
MAASVSLVVLYPNGRQQTIKAAKNTSIWQVLEDACKKQQLNPADYELYHHNNKLNPTLLVSLTNLPNNAQLELREGQCQGLDQGTTTICLQLESGERLTEEFVPSITLWDILSYWEKKVGLARLRGPVAGDPVCVYMRLEIVGKKNLQDTTLRKLGLIGGKAVVRLLFRPSQMMGEQAHVSRTYTVPFKDHDAVHNVVPTGPSTKDISPGTSTAVPSIQRSKDPLVVEPSNKTICQGTSVEEVIKKEDVSTSDRENQLIIHEEDIKYIGERKGILFDLEHSLPYTMEEPGEEFFQLTIEDAKYLAADYRRQRMLLEERPLETDHLRHIREVQKARTYSSALLRIYFPNRLVLQGTFLPQERVADVMDFVRGFLQHPNQDFYLYTSPPKTVLEPGCTIVNLVPAAVVHFGSNHPLPEELLRKEVMSRISTPGGASVAAVRLWSKRSVLDADPQEVVQAPPKILPKVSPGKTPKWFSMGKKTK